MCGRRYGSCNRGGENIGVLNIKSFINRLLYEPSRMIDEGHKPGVETTLQPMLLLEMASTGYADALEIQTRIVERKINVGGPDVLIVLEHPPTVTLGIRGNPSHLLVSEQELASRGVGLFKVDRGGEATFHGPGQLVSYPILDLKSHRLTVRQYVQGLEETIIRSLAVFGVKSFRRREAPGVWVDPTKKIASIGVKIKRRITFHGFSLNVDLKTDPGELIITCGEPNIRMINLNQVVRPKLSMKAVREIVVQHFGDVFGIAFERSSLAEALSLC